MFPMLNSNNPTIKIKTSKNILFKGNTYLVKANTILKNR